MCQVRSNPEAKVSRGSRRGMDHVRICCCSLWLCPRDSPPKLTRSCTSKFNIHLLGRVGNTSFPMPREVHLKSLTTCNDIVNAPLWFLNRDVMIKRGRPHRASAYLKNESRHRRRVDHSRQRGRKVDSGLALTYYSNYISCWRPMTISVD